MAREISITGALELLAKWKHEGTPLAVLFLDSGRTPVMIASLFGAAVSELENAVVVFTRGSEPSDIITASLEGAELELAGPDDSLPIAFSEIGITAEQYLQISREDGVLVIAELSRPMSPE